MLQHSASLLDGNAREPVYELVYGRIVFEVLEQGCDGDARTAKDPRAAEHGWILLYSGTGRPVNHGVDGSTGGDL